MTRPKETYFFNRYFDRGLDWYGSHWTDLGSAVHGEVCPTYMYDSRCARRIAEAVPEVQILAILRNPFHRARSHLLMHVEKSWGSTSHVATDALRRCAQGKKEYLDYSCYHRFLVPFYELFGPDRIQILFHDDIVGKEARFASEVYRAVGVDDGFEPPSLLARPNKTVDQRFPGILKRLIRISRIVRRTSLGDRGLGWIHRKTDLRERVINVGRVDRGIPDVPFVKVFGIAGRDRLLEDLDRLRSDIGIDWPKGWTSGI